MVQADFVPGFGAGFTGGVVYDSDTPSESGLFTSPSGVVGLNAGVAMCGGWAARDIEGTGTEFDINAPVFSPTVLADAEGLNGIMVGFGPGGGGSLHYSDTTTWTFAEVGEAIAAWVPWLF